MLVTRKVISSRTSMNDAERALICSNDAPQAPRATGVQHGTRALSRRCLHRLCYALSFALLPFFEKVPHVPYLLFRRWLERVVGVPAFANCPCQVFEVRLVLHTLRDNET